MNARDELGKLLFTLPVSDRAGDTAPEIMTLCDEAAEVILEAGWRKPRIITAAAELDALPVGSIVCGFEGRLYVKDSIRVTRSWWVTVNEQFDFETKDIELPATVLHEPEAGRG